MQNGNGTYIYLPNCHVSKHFHLLVYAQGRTIMFWRGAGVGGLENFHMQHFFI